MFLQEFPPLTSYGKFSGGDLPFLLLTRISVSHFLLSLVHKELIAQENRLQPCPKGLCVHLPTPCHSSQMLPGTLQQRLNFWVSFWAVPSEEQHSTLTAAVPRTRPARTWLDSCFQPRQSPRARLNVPPGSGSRHRALRLSSVTGWECWTST